jgi:lysophospholipase L1-like esterase
MHHFMYLTQVLCEFTGVEEEESDSSRTRRSRITTSLSRKKRVLFSLAAVFVVILLSLLVAEAGVRVFCPQRIIPRYVESAPWGVRKILPHVNGVHLSSEYKCRYRTNSKGFRGTAEYALVPPEHCFRIVVQGDSVTMGLGVEDDETYSYVLEDMLRRDGINAEVINMGIPGFGTAEELIQFHAVAKEYKPDLVILGFFYNDYMNNAICGLFTNQNGVLARTENNFIPGIYIRDRLNAVPGYSFLSQHSHLMTLVRNMVSFRIIEGLEMKAHFHDSQKPQAGALSEKYATAEAIALTKLLLETYAEDVADTGAGLFIVDLADKSWTSSFPMGVQHDEKTRIISTYDAFRRALDDGHNPFYKVDGHPDEDGHRAIATCIYERLQHEWEAGTLPRK